MIQALILYFQFFTRIPIPVPIDDPLDKMKQGVAYFSFFGLLVSLIEAGVFFLLSWVMDLNLAWVMILLLDVLLTGGFHLDALADMTDGLFSSRQPDRMLEIMKDSRIGSNGVLSLIFYYASCILAFVNMTHAGLLLSEAVFIVIGLNVVGKMAITILFYQATYKGASETGSGNAFIGVSSKSIWVAQITGLICLLVLFRWQGLIIYLVIAGVICLYRKMVYQKVGGLNGDTMGAASPIAQVIYLVVLSSLHSRGLL